MSNREIDPRIQSLPNEEARKVAVLVAWPYGNGPRHLGHGASLVPGDVIARYQRSIGNDVLMVSGTDEHGTPNMIAAEKANMEPADYVAETSQVIRDDFINLGMSFDWFTRTTSPEHKSNAQELFAKLVDAEYIEKGTMLGAFDQETGQSLPDRYVEGTCPTCGASSRGDQCESCSRMLEPSELLNPISKLTGNPVEMREREHYFLQLDKLADDVVNWLEDNQELRPNAKAVSIEMAKNLRPRAITRDMSWGIPLPEGYELADDGDKVMYVWFEAVIGYISASIEWSTSNQDESVIELPNWEDWWKNEEARHYYVMGKDNVPFHTIIWPAILSAAEKSGYGEVHQPDVIASTEYLTFNNDKFSSSRGNVVYVQDMLRLLGPDALRYYFISAGPETRDTTFSFEEITRKVNDELVAKWGNLVSRSSSLIAKNHAGQIPDVKPEMLGEEDTFVIEELKNTYGEVGELIEAAKFGAALRRVMETVAVVNKYIYDKEPWKTVKSDKELAEKTMYTVLTSVNNLAVLFSPFMPHSSQQVYELFGYTDELVSQPYAHIINQETGFTVLTGDYAANRNRWQFSWAQPGSMIEPHNKHLFKKIDQEKLKEDFETIARDRQMGKTVLKNTVSEN